MKYRLTVIDRVHFTGKWVEFWFTEVDGKPASEVYQDIRHDSYHDCSKGGYLWGAIEAAGIHDHVMTHGLHGRTLRWKMVGVNWEIDQFMAMTEPVGPLVPSKVS